MKFPYSKSVFIFCAPIAGALLVYELIVGLDPGRIGGSLSKMFVVPLVMLPFTLIFDAIAAWRGRGGRLESADQCLQFQPQQESGQRDPKLSDS